MKKQQLQVSFIPNNNVDFNYSYNEMHILICFSWMNNITDLIIQIHRERNKVYFH